MDDFLIILFAALGAFLLGSLPVGLWIARKKGIDLREIGSGNIGATNTGRALGKRWGIVVLFLDALKGWSPTFLFLLFQDFGKPAVIVALAAICGHMFSIFLRGKGGKGVATSFGACLAMAPMPALGAFLVYALLLAAFRISSIGSLAGVWSVIFFLWLKGGSELPLYVFAIVNALLVTARHRDNLKRLRRGQELNI